MIIFMSRIPYFAFGMIENFTEDNLKKIIIITENRFLSSYEELSCKVIGVEDYLCSEEILRILKEIKNTYGISDLIGIDEFDIDRSALFREILSVKTRMSYVDALQFRNKSLMKLQLEKLRESELNIPKHMIVGESKSKLSRFINQVGFPIILKPTSDAATRGIIKINSEKQLEKVISSLPTKGEYMAEECIQSTTMYTVDGYFCKDKLNFYCVHQYDRSLLESVINCQKSMSIFTADIYENNPKMLSRIEKIINDIYLTFCEKEPFFPFHLELFYNKDLDIFSFCEIGARYGGANIPDLIKLSYDIDVWKEYYKSIFLDDEVYFSVARFPSKYSATYHYYQRAGILKHLPNNIILPYVVNATFFVKVGQKLSLPTSVNNNICSVQIVADTFDELKSYIEEVERYLDENIIIE